MNEAPLVSICSITFNHEKYISQAIEGFLMQKTNFHYEILIHDDASLDGTVDIIKEYVKKYPDLIKPIFQSENQYSKGIKPYHILYKKALGKYIARCEGDDFWIDPYKLQKQVDVLSSNSNYIFSAHKINVVNRKGLIVDKKIGQGHNKTVITQLDCISKGVNIHPSSLMYRNVLTKIPEYFKKVISEDGTLVVELLTYGNGHFSDEIMSCYRLNETGVWSNTTDLERNVEWINMEFFLMNRLPQYSEKIKGNISEKSNWIIHHLDRHNIFDFLKFWKKWVVSGWQYSIPLLFNILLKFAYRFFTRKLKYYLS